MPDLILREEELGTALPDLARSMGHTNPPEPEVCPEDMPYTLEQIYDERSWRRWRPKHTSATICNLDSAHGGRSRKIAMRAE